MKIKLDFEQRERAGRLHEQMVNHEHLEGYAFEIIYLRDELQRLRDAVLLWASSPGDIDWLCEHSPQMAPE